jgi:hypothetical protein
MLNYHFINIILSKCNIILLKKLQNIFTNNVFIFPNKIKYHKNIDFTCAKCSGILIKHIHNDNNQCKYNIIDKIYCIISHEHYDSIIYYVCKNCKYIYLSCVYCCDSNNIILCQYCGNDGTINKNNNTIIRIKDKYFIDYMKQKYKNINKYIVDGYLELDNDSVNEIDSYYDTNNLLNLFICETNSRFRYDGPTYEICDKKLEFLDYNKFIHWSDYYCKEHTYWKCHNCQKQYYYRYP